MLRCSILLCGCHLKQDNTCHSVASKYVCAGQHPHGAAGANVVDDVFVVAPAEPPPSKVAQLQKTSVSESQNGLVQLSMSAFPRRMAAPLRGQHLREKYQNL